MRLWPQVLSHVPVVFVAYTLDIVHAGFKTIEKIHHQHVTDHPKLI